MLLSVSTRSILQAFSRINNVLCTFACVRMHNYYVYMCVSVCVCVCVCMYACLYMHVCVYYSTYAILPQYIYCYQVIFEK